MVNVKIILISLELPVQFWKNVYSDYCTTAKFFKNTVCGEEDQLERVTPNIKRLPVLLHNCITVRGWIKEFWNYSHISLNIRQNYIKLIQNTELTFPHFAMMFEWRNTQEEMWRHRLMTSCNSHPVRQMTENVLSKWRTMTNNFESFGEFLFLD